MNHGDAERLFNENGQLRERVYRRATFIEYELSHLRALRVELELAAVPPRKRRRATEQLPHALLPVEQESLKFKQSSAFVVALQTEVQNYSSRAAASALTKSDWETIAAALHRAGHRSCTPYKLLTIFKELHRADLPFTTAEVQALCQLVHENGYNWPVVRTALRQLFGHDRQVFEMAQQYRICLRCAFVQNNLTPAQLTKLLDSDAISAQHRDYDQLSVEAGRFTAHKALQVSPRYLQKEIESLAFARYVPVRHHLYWKVINLILRLPLWNPYRLDAFHHRMPLCHQQLSAADLSRNLDCTSGELTTRVVQYLLRLSRTPDKLDFEECSRKMFGNASAASVICQIAEELHQPGA
jgi:hypothetical protein